MSEREMKVAGVSGGLGLAVWILGGPIAGALAAGAGWLVAQKQLPKQDVPWRNVGDLLSEGEHGRLEFKGCFFDKKTEVSKGIIKTLIAFLNTDGGELVIGLSDVGEVVGIDQELELTKGKDKLELKIRDVLKTGLSSTVHSQYRIKFEEYQGKTLCRIDVSPSNKKIFDSKGGFFRRDGNRTIAYSAKDYHELKQKEDSVI